MTSRTELTELIYRAVIRVQDVNLLQETTEAILDSIEPLIRADERENGIPNDGLIVAKALAYDNLRTKVKALREEAFAKAAACPVGSEERAAWDGRGMAHSMTLTLLDGGSDD